MPNNDWLDKRVQDANRKLSALPEWKRDSLRAQIDELGRRRSALGQGVSGSEPENRKQSERATE
jgi:hypothetical protein